MFVPRTDAGLADMLKVLPSPAATNRLHPGSGCSRRTESNGCADYGAADTLSLKVFFEIQRGLPYERTVTFARGAGPSVGSHENRI